MKNFLFHSLFVTPQECDMPQTSGVLWTLRGLYDTCFVSLFMFSRPLRSCSASVLLILRLAAVYCRPNQPVCYATWEFPYRNWNNVQHSLSSEYWWDLTLKPMNKSERWIYFLGNFLRRNISWVTTITDLRNHLANKKHKTWLLFTVQHCAI